MKKQLPWRVAAAALATPIGLGAALATAGALGAGLGWPLELASHFRVHYLLAALVSALLFVAAGHRRTAAAAALLVMINAIPVGALYRPGEPTPEGGTPLRLLLINVNRGNDRYDEVLDEVARHDADVVLLEEVTPAWSAAMASLEATYPHIWSVPRNGYFGLALYSRLPLDRVTTETLADERLPSIDARLTVGGRPIRLLGTHPPPPTGSESAALRDRQLAAVGDWVAAGSSPAVVLGDLNASPFSPALRRLGKRSKLVNAMAGRGVVPTWPVQNRLLRIPIDHCLHDRRLQVLHAARGRDIGSDHFPLVVDLQVPPP